MNPDIIRGNDAIAAYLGITAKTFIKWRDECNIPYYRIGSIVLAKRDALDEWIKEREEDWK